MEAVLEKAIKTIASIQYLNKTLFWLLLVESAKTSTLMEADIRTLEKSLLNTKIKEK